MTWEVKGREGVLRQFVLDFCDGKLFTDKHCSSVDELRMSFMVLALASPDQLPKDIGCVYERVDKAGPIGINGLPCFFSVQFLSKAEWERVEPVIRQEMKRREEFTVPP